MKSIFLKSDTFGAFASILCLIHCVTTPFIFVAKSCSAVCCSSAPGWWGILDYFFLAISFFAVYHSSKTTSKKIMKPALWFSWYALLIVILNDKVKLIEAPIYLLYITSLLMALLHLYNLKYCQCKTNQCCIHNE